MDIMITTFHETGQNDFQDSVADRIRRMLSRFSSRITSIDVALTDENGPRGGVDQQCRISILMPGIGRVATRAKDHNPWAAVDQAARRARRRVMTKIKRPRSQRERYRCNHMRGKDNPELSAELEEGLFS